MVIMNSVYYDILPSFNYYKLTPHIYFLYLSTHFEVLSSCDEDSLIHEDSMNEVDVEDNIMVHDIFDSISKTFVDFLDNVASLYIESHIVDVVDLHEEFTSLFYIPYYLVPFEDIIVMSLPYLDDPPSPHTSITSLDPSHALFVL